MFSNRQKLDRSVLVARAVERVSVHVLVCSVSWCFLMLRESLLIRGQTDAAASQAVSSHAPSRLKGQGAKQWVCHIYLSVLDSAHASTVLLCSTHACASMSS